jgi:hypothetical protein
MDGIRLQNADENRLSRLTVSVNAATIARNTANENGALGIEAVAGSPTGWQQGEWQRRRRPVHRRRVLVGSSTT